MEFEWILAIVALVNHEVFGPGGDGPLTIAQRTPLCEFLHITIGAIRRTILDAVNGTIARLNPLDSQSILFLSVSQFLCQSISLSDYQSI